jgi:putative tricarboxylic transport membrane protein
VTDQHRQTEPPTGPGEGTVPVWWVELAVASALALVGGLVIVDSLRVGIGWGLEGPQSGFFPFYVGLILFAASTWTFALNLVPTRRDTENFVERSSLRRVLALLVPAIVFVLAARWVGLYVAGALLIAFFMRVIGRFTVVRSAGVAAAIAVALFLVFEIWFLMPLPEGPLEAALGY